MLGRSLLARGLDRRRVPEPPRAELLAAALLGDHREHRRDGMREVLVRERGRVLALGLGLALVQHEGPPRREGLALLALLRVHPAAHHRAHHLLVVRLAHQVKLVRVAARHLGRARAEEELEPLAPRGHPVAQLQPRTIHAVFDAHLCL